MINLIVNADDFGYSAGVNYGIIESHQHGIVNSTTIMMNMPGTKHAIKLAKQNPSLKVGIHLVLTCGKPILSDVSSLVDDNGCFKSLSYWMKHKDMDLAELEREWTAQIEAYYDAGLVPNHFDSHHHVHGWEELYPIVKKLSDKYKLPVRRPSHSFKLSYYSDIFLDDFYGETISENYFNCLKDKVADGHTVEIMTHPGFVDQEVLNGSSYTLLRAQETYILTHVKLPEYISLV
ncbi:chitin disaccharide deacetylase [Bacillus sp. FJAT-49736]|uniref:chitin disaccharide deacetylase n=1 Tax=Bacillus sp. FJAT-49736 TaxID=2833582 RepID=UPI001BCA3C06|nr:chitin disaccharide deacetylase [Bacillus sp. FJAT-49736]MBS4174562.1 chitin disaccharide deacetylase [Bacillus sp. FJAT-49736]